MSTQTVTKSKTRSRATSPEKSRSPSKSRSSSSTRKSRRLRDLSTEIPVDEKNRLPLTEQKRLVSSWIKDKMSRKSSRANSTERKGSDKETNSEETDGDTLVNENTPRDSLGQDGGPEGTIRPIINLDQGPPLMAGTGGAQAPSSSKEEMDPNDLWGLNRSQATIMSTLNPGGPREDITSLGSGDLGSDNPFGVFPQIMDFPDQTAPPNGEPPLSKIPKLDGLEMEGLGANFGASLQVHQKSTPGKLGESLLKSRDSGRGLPSPNKVMANLGEQINQEARPPPVDDMVERNRIALETLTRTLAETSTLLKGGGTGGEETAEEEWKTVNSQPELEHSSAVKTDQKTIPTEANQGDLAKTVTKGEGALGEGAGDPPGPPPRLCSHCHQRPATVGPLCVKCAEKGGSPERLDPRQCRLCSNLAVRGELCEPCLNKASSRKRDSGGWTAADVDNYLEQFRESILKLRMSSQGRVLGSDMIRSKQTIEELRLFRHIVGMLEGSQELNRNVGSQIAIHNLRSDPDDSVPDPPVIKILGLKEAILNIDQIQETPYREAATYHLAVMWRKLEPRPMDGHSYEILQDDVLQSWFERLFIVRRVTLDPGFKEWTLSGEIWGEPIKRGPQLTQRVRFFEECTEVMSGLYNALRLQPGARGPSQNWDKRIGLSRIPETNLGDHLAPRLLWNMRLLGDCIHLKTLQKQEWSREGYNLHRLTSTLKSILNAFQIMVDKVLAPQNKDIHLASFALARRLDEKGDPTSRPPPWADFPFGITPWLLPERWEAMRDELDVWVNELHVTMEFRNRIVPPSPGVLPSKFIPERQPLGMDKKGVPLEGTPAITGKVGVSFSRGEVGTGSIYQPHDASRNEPDVNTRSYVDVIREVLPGPKRPRSRSEEHREYISNRPASSANTSNRGREATTRGRQNGLAGSGAGGSGRLPHHDGGGGGGEPPWRPPNGGGGDEPGDSDDDNEDDTQGRERRPRRCGACGSQDHRRGDAECPSTQRYCHLCLTNAHDYSSCHLRSDAPRCQLCGGTAHPDPRQCPTLLAEERLREKEEARSKDNLNLSYARWRARMELGSDLKGKYLQESDITLNSEYKNELARRRREEEKRLREESRRTQLHQENLTRTLQRAAIESAEVTRQMTSSQLAALPDGAELSPKTREHIEKAGATVFLNHLGGMGKPSSNPMKDVSLDDLGFGKDVVFSGDNRGLTVTEFLKIFDAVKESRQWDDTVSAKLVSARFRGPARVWFDNMTLDPARRIDAAFYSSLKGHLLQRFRRRRDWVDRNSLFRQVKWDVGKYRGSHLSLWEDCQNAALRYMEDCDPKETFTVKQVQDLMSSQHFFTEARDEITMFLMEKGVENDVEGIVRELQRKEEIMMSNRRRGYRPPTEPFRRASYKINALEQDPEVDQRTPLERYWEDAESETELESETCALKKGGEGGADEEDKLCWHCGRPGHLKSGCPELKEMDRRKPKKPGEDGRFKTEEVPGYETEAVRRTWVGPKVNSGLKAGRTPKTRSRYTPLKRPRGSRRPTTVRRDRTYKSRRTNNTYRVAALGIAFTGEDDEVIGQLDQILVAGEGGEDTEEELEDDLMTIYSPAEIAELGHQGSTTPGVSDPPEVSAVSRPISLNDTEGAFQEGRPRSAYGESGRCVPFSF